MHFGKLPDNHFDVKKDVNIAQRFSSHKLEKKQTIN